MPPLRGVLLVGMESVTDCSPRCSQVVLEQSGEARRCRVVTEIPAQRLDLVVVEIDRRPGMEFHKMQRLVIALRLTDAGLSGLVVSCHFNRAERVEKPLLLRQLLSHPVFVHLPDVHFHGFRRLCLEDGGAFRGGRIEPEGVAAPEVVRAAVAGVGELPGLAGRRVEPVQLLDAVPVADEVQDVILPFQVLHRLGRGVQDAGPSVSVQPPDAETAVVHAQAVDGVVHPGRIGELDARRGGGPQEKMTVLLVDDDEVASAFDRIFHDGDAARARLGIVQPALGREVAPLSAPFQRADDGFSVQGPADAGDRFAPEQPVLARVEGAGTSRKSPEVIFGPVQVDPDQPRRQVFPLFDGQVFVVDPGAVRVVGRESVFPGDLLHFHERAAGVGLFGPDVMEALHDALPGVFEGFPRDAADMALQRRDGEGFPAYPVEIIGRERRPVVEIPHAGDGHVADGIVIRTGFFEGTVHPFVPVAPVAVVEGEVVIVQEISGAPPAGGREGRFRDDGVAFQECRRGEEGADSTGPHLAHEVIHPTERLPVGQLHLGDMAGFMDRQLRHPGQRDGTVRFRVRVQVHPFRRPGHGSVGIRVERMQDDRRPAPLQAAGRHACAPSHDRLPFFQVQEIGPRQGIQPFRIDDAVMVRLHLRPSAERVGPVLVELGRRGGSGRETGGKEEKPETHHTTKLTIFS